MSCSLCLCQCQGHICVNWWGKHLRAGLRVSRSQHKTRFDSSGPTWCKGKGLQLMQAALGLVLRLALALGIGVDSSKKFVDQLGTRV